MSIALSEPLNEHTDVTMTAPKKEVPVTFYAEDEDSTAEPLNGTLRSMTRKGELQTEKDKFGNTIRRATALLYDAIHVSHLERVLIKVALFILMLLPFVENPSSLVPSPDLRYISERKSCPCGILEAFDLAALFVLFGTAIFKLYLFEPYKRIRSSFWVIMELPLLTISLADVFVSIASQCTERYRIRRYLRIYFLLCHVTMARKTLNGLRSSFKALASTALSAILVFIGIVIINICLFSTPLTLQLEFFILVFMFLNFFLVIIYKEFKGYFNSSMRIRLIKRRIATIAMFEVLKIRMRPYFAVRNEDLLAVLDNIDDWFSKWWKKKLYRRIELQKDGAFGILVRISMGLGFLRTIRIIFCFECTREIWYTMRDIPYNLAPVIVIFWAAYYEFALVGMNSFQGAIVYNSSVIHNCPGSYVTSNYWNQNFDDFYTSVNTLHYIMLLNNWNYIVDMLICCTGSSWPFYFVVLWWFTSSVLILSIVFALIADTYQYRLTAKELEISRRKSRVNLRSSSVGRIASGSLVGILEAAFDLSPGTESVAKMKKKSSPENSHSPRKLSEDLSDLLSNVELAEDEEMKPTEPSLSTFACLILTIKQCLIDCAKQMAIIELDSNRHLHLKRSTFIFGHDIIKNYAYDEIYA
ncbi:Two pore calcium channel protein 2 [Cichlidogyrus casuarinus]|uniref:Two pore calcium channel protein 2 n=1 Tax=Cichlidogyrus casuarinus TaxID=1844966 RepID=A0ABD2QQH8_9PLAT